MRRVFAYCWCTWVVWLTAGLPDFWFVMWFRGLLIRPALGRCGRNLQIGSGVTLASPNRIRAGDDVFIARGTWIQAYAGVELADQVIIGPYVVVATANHTKRDGSWRFGPPALAPISIGRGAWLGAHVVVTAGVEIGEGVAVGAGAVVTRSTSSHTVVAGVPAKVLSSVAT